MARHTDLKSLEREIRGRSPVRASLLLLAILAFLLASVLWANRTELDDVTRADGRIVPSGDLQVIEATEPGVIQAVHVREGQVVDKGTLLMELDGAQLNGQLGQELQRSYGLRVRIERLKSEINSSNLKFDDELLVKASNVVRSETALYRGRQDEVQAEVNILERQRLGRQQEFEEALTDRETARETLAVLAEERALLEPLVDRGMEPATTLLTLRRSEAEWRGREIRAKAVMSRLDTGLAEVDDRIKALKNRFRSAALTDLALATAELAALEPALPVLKARAARAQLRAPVRGIVNRVHRSTIGSLARSGDELIEIVPLDDSLLVQAYVRPADIAFLHPGQAVKVKITAYDFSRYGSLNGEILRIGADTITRSERNDEEVFVVEVRTENNMLDAAGQAVEIIPGMTAEVDILTGRKTVLEYLIRPVVRVKERALRE